jgi:hypothetical protein
MPRVFLQNVSREWRKTMPFQTWVDNDATKPLSAARMNSIQNSLPFINVKDPALPGGGAKGDGNLANDDSVAINAAINALGTTGGTVYFPVGRYVCRNPINLTNKRFVRLVGENGTAAIVNSAGGTRIQMHGTAFAAQQLVLVEGNTAILADGPTFEHLLFEYLGSPTNGAAYGSTPPKTLLYLKNVNHVAIRNCTFMGAEKGIEIPEVGTSGDNAWYLISKCFFRYNKYGIWGSPRAAEVYSAAMFATDDGTCVHLLPGTAWFSMFGCKLEGRNVSTNNAIGVRTEIANNIASLEFHNTKMEGLRTGFSFGGGRGIKILGGTFTGSDPVTGPKTGIDIGAQVNLNSMGFPVGQGLFISGISFENMGASNGVCVKEASPTPAPETQYFGPWRGNNVGLQPMIIRAPRAPVNGVDLAQTGVLWMNSVGGVNSSLWVNQAGTSAAPMGVWKNLG